MHSGDMFSHVLRYAQSGKLRIYMQRGGVLTLPPCTSCAEPSLSLSDSLNLYFSLIPSQALSVVQIAVVRMRMGWLAC